MPYHNDLVKDIERIQKRALRIIYPDLTYSVALKNSGISTLEDRRKYLSSKLFNEIASNNNHKLAKLLPPNAASRDLRNKRTFEVSLANTLRYENTFIPHYAKKHCI